MPVEGTDSWQPKSATTDNLNTTDIFKTAEAADDPADDLEGSEVLVVKVGPQDTLAKILAKAGAPEWDVHSMIEAGHSIFPENGARSRPGSSHHACSVVVRSEQERAGPLLDLLRRPRPSRHRQPQRGR